MARVLVIDDEPGIVNYLSRALSSQGFGVDSAYDGAKGLELAERGGHELILLDLMIPVLDGFTVLKRILAGRPEQPVLVLSALTDVQSKIRCLELGASDFVAKPFVLAELLARVRVRMGRPAGRPLERVLVAGPVKLELLRRTVDCGNGPVSLSEREFLLLQHLVRHKDQVCTREQLLEEVWGCTFDPRTNVVDVYISRLRAKLGNDRIETVRNVGYCLQAS